MAAAPFALKRQRCNCGGAHTQTSRCSVPAVPCALKSRLALWLRCRSMEGCDTVHSQITTCMPTLTQQHMLCLRCRSHSNHVNTAVFITRPGFGHSGASGAYPAATVAAGGRGEATPGVGFEESNENAHTDMPHTPHDDRCRPAVLHDMHSVTAYQTIQTRQPFRHVNNQALPRRVLSYPVPTPAASDHP